MSTRNARFMTFLWRQNRLTLPTVAVTAVTPKWATAIELQCRYADTCVHPGGLGVGCLGAAPGATAREFGILVQRGPRTRVGARDLRDLRRQPAYRCLRFHRAGRPDEPGPAHRRRVRRLARGPERRHADAHVDRGHRLLVSEPAAATLSARRRRPRHASGQRWHRCGHLIGNRTAAGARL